MTEKFCIEVPVKFVQLASIPATPAMRSAIIALDDEGQIWMYSDGDPTWELVPPPTKKKVI